MDRIPTYLYTNHDNFCQEVMAEGFGKSKLTCASWLVCVEIYKMYIYCTMYM